MSAENTTEVLVGGAVLAAAIGFLVYAGQVTGLSAGGQPEYELVATDQGEVEVVVLEAVEVHTAVEATRQADTEAVEVEAMEDTHSHHPTSLKCSIQQPRSSASSLT